MKLSFGGACSQINRGSEKPAVSDKSEKVIKSLTLKQRFLSAVINGELGSIDSRGYIVTLKDADFSHKCATHVNDAIFIA